MLSKVTSFCLSGLRGRKIEIETDLQRGIPEINFVGRCGGDIRESAKRVKSAVANQNFTLTPYKITVSMTPADIPKNGSGFDLPVAVGILCAYGIIPREAVSGFAFIGELGLDGSIRGVRGILPMAVCAIQEGVRKIMVPKENEEELSLLDCTPVFVQSLRDAVSFLCAENTPENQTFRDVVINKPEEKRENICGSGEKIHGIKKRLPDVDYEYDFYDVSANEYIKRALEIAVSGGHNILMLGSKGSGKTMLAKCIPGILPEMNEDEIMETASIYSAAGLFDTRKNICGRPFREVHSGITAAALTGGGRLNTPGEISLCHNGVLFADELTEMNPAVLDALRQPMENKKIIITRYGITEVFPADFLFVGAANPCRCGYLFDSRKKCTCTQQQIRSKMQRLSGPLLDRIDIQVAINSLLPKDLQKKGDEKSSDIRKRVERTRQIQAERLKNEKVKQNGNMDKHLTEKYCILDDDTLSFLNMASERLGLSARGYFKVLKIARTIADMDMREKISREDIAEAVGYRELDRRIEDVF